MNSNKVKKGSGCWSRKTSALGRRHRVPTLRKAKADSPVYGRLGWDGEVVGPGSTPATQLLRSPPWCRPTSPAPVQAPPLTLL